MDREKPARFIPLAEAFPKLSASKVFLGFSLRTHALRSINYIQELNIITSLSNQGL